MTTAHLPHTRGTKWWWFLLVIPGLIAIGLAVALLKPLVISSSQPTPRGTIYCINDDQYTCDIVSSVFGGTGQQVLANVVVSPVCTDEVIAAAVTNADAILVDGNMPGSQYQGVECVERLVAVRGINLRPLIFAYSTEPDIRRRMMAQGATEELAPTDIMNSYRAIVAALGW